MFKELEEGQCGWIGRIVEDEGGEFFELGRVLQFMLRNFDFFFLNIIGSY